MIGIVIVAHDKLSSGFLHTVDHVVGRQPGMTAVMVDSDHDRDAVQAAIEEAIRSVDRDNGVVVVTDLFGGSPCNLSVKACEGPDQRIIYGANVPLLLKLTKSRHLPLTDAIRIAVDAGRKYIGWVPGTGHHE